jgi:hypothetical protein
MLEGYASELGGGEEGGREGGGGGEGGGRERETEEEEEETRLPDSLRGFKQDDGRDNFTLEARNDRIRDKTLQCVSRIKVPARRGNLC